MRMVKPLQRFKRGFDFEDEILDLVKTEFLPETIETRKNIPPDLEIDILVENKIAIEAKKRESRYSGWFEIIEGHPITTTKLLYCYHSIHNWDECRDYSYVMKKILEKYDILIFVTDTIVEPHDPYSSSEDSKHLIACNKKHFLSELQYVKSLMN